MYWYRFTWHMHQFLCGLSPIDDFGKQLPYVDFLPNLVFN